MYKRTIVLLAAVVLGGAGEGTADDGQAVRVEPIMLRVVDAAAMELSDAMVPFNAKPGTTVTLLLRSPEGERFVSIDEAASEIERFHDDGGTNLLEPAEARAAAGGEAQVAAQEQAEGERDGENDGGAEASIASPWMLPAGSNSPIGSFPQISDDGRLATVEVVGARTPTPGSAAVVITGRLALQLAAGTRTYMHEPVALEAGERVEVADEAFEITQVRPTRWGDYRLDVTLRMSSDTYSRLAGLRFVDEAGETIKSGRFSHMQMGEVATIQYGLERDVEAAAIEFVFHDELRRTEAALDLEVSLGL